MHEESLPAMPFPSPSSTLLEQAGTDAPSGQLRTWMHALPKTIQHYLSQWQAEWTGESLKQGYFGYVLPCRCQDGTSAILKLSPFVHEAKEQAVALSGWAGCGAAPLLAKSFDENGAVLLIGRIIPGVAVPHAHIRPFLDDLHARLEHGAIVLFLDNLYVEVTAAPLLNVMMSETPINRGNSLMELVGQFLSPLLSLIKTTSAIEPAE
jgi:hypothetical protein